MKFHGTCRIIIPKKHVWLCGSIVPRGKLYPNHTKGRHEILKSDNTSPLDAHASKHIYSHAGNGQCPKNGLLWSKMDWWRKNSTLSWQPKNRCNVIQVVLSDSISTERRNLERNRNTRFMLSGFWTMLHTVYKVHDHPGNYCSVRPSSISEKLQTSMKFKF